MASRRVTHVNRSIRSSPRTHNAARGNVLFYLEYAPGQSPGRAIGKRHVRELSRERGGSKHRQTKLKRNPITHPQKRHMSQPP